jgi:hypothetical protein
MGRGVLEIDGSVVDAVPRAPVLGGRQTPLPQLDAYARDAAKPRQERVVFVASHVSADTVVALRAAKTALLATYAPAGFVVGVTVAALGNFGLPTGHQTRMVGLAIAPQRVRTAGGRWASQLPDHNGPFALFCGQRGTRLRMAPV